MRTFFAVIILVFSIASFAQNDTYTFVFLNKNPGAPKISKEESDKLMEGHMANINRLAVEKKLLAAGPFDGGGGIFILNTTSQEEAKAWLHSDPGVQAKRWNIEYLPYEPRIGSVCPVTEPYEMVSYFFIRYRSAISKFNAGTYPTLLHEHMQFLRNGSLKEMIITEGGFDQEGNSMVILSQEVPLDLLETDRAVQEGLLSIETKKLFIARGSFCEEK